MADIHITAKKIDCPFFSLIMFRMYQKPLGLVLLILFCGGCLFGQEIAWQHNIKDAQKTARETGKPVLYDFSATWCKPCQAMEKTFWPRPEVVEATKRFICVKVDFDRDKALAEKY